MIRVITESISCMTAQDCADYGVSLLPLKNVFGGVPVEDKIANFKVAQDGFTMPPSEFEYYSAFRSALAEDGDGVICITLSHKLSNAYVNAKSAAMQFPSAKVAVIDSRTVAGGLLLIVRKLRRLEAQGLDFARIVEELERFRNGIVLQFYLSDMSAINRAKRISSFSSAGRPILNQKPIFAIENGGVRYMATRNSVHACIREFVALAKGLEEVIVHYSDLAAGRELADLIRKNCGKEPLLRQVTASLLINIGNDVLSVVGVKPQQ